MYIIPEHLNELALANKISHLKSKYYFKAENNSDSYFGLKKNQPGVSNPKLNLSIPSYWTGADRNELKLKLKANNQIGYVFITDDFGEIWYESEIAPFQRILKIDTSLFPTGNYNILIESDGLFRAKQFTM